MHRIAFHLRMSRSTVEKILKRFGMPLLSRIDKVTGLPVRKARPVRYEHDRPGDLVHVDVKKLGRIPNGGGHRTLGRTAGNRNNKWQGRGYAYLHQAVDGHPRFAYSDILPDEKKDTAAGFWTNDALGPGIKHKYTRPYRPQTNGKVERFNRLYQDWIHHYNHDRPHSGINGQRPIERVHNLNGSYS